MKIPKKEKSKSSNSSINHFPFFNIQPKLSIGSLNDKYEKEADAQAEKVVSQNPISSNSTPFFKTNKIQPKSESDSPSSVSTSFQNKLNSKKSSGSKLPEDTTQKMNQAFQTDFGNVKIHTDSTAENLNNEIGAQAFTHQNNVFFNKNKFNPSSQEGEKLIAHELTHVVQQQATSPLIQRDPTPEEIAAKKIADKKTSIISTFKLAEIGGDKDWTLEELTKLEAALNTLPATDKTVIKKLKILRVISLAGDTAGEFGANQSVDSDGNVVNEASITLDDDAFSGDTQSSKLIIVHEVGHAIASLKNRTATHAEHQATSTVNKLTKANNELIDQTDPLLESFNESVEVLNDLVDRLNQAIKDKDQATIDDLKPKAAAARTDYQTKKAAWEAEDKKIQKGKAAISTAKETEETKEKATQKTMISASDLATIKGKVEPAKNLFDGKYQVAATFVDGLDEESKTASQNYHTTIKNVTIEIGNLSSATHDTQLKESEVETLIENVNTQMTERKNKREALETSSGDTPHPALAKFSGVEVAQDKWFYTVKAHSLAHERYKRVQKFVAFVEQNNIEPITRYARDNWPHKPEEFYAEAYSWFIVQPDNLKTTSAILHKWFADGKHKS